MRRSHAGRLVAAALALSAAAACTNVSGSVDIDGGLPLGLVITVDARNGGRGTVSMINRGFAFSGDVTCLAVSGNRATVGAYDDLGGFPFNVLIFIEDNGTPPPGEGVDVVTTQQVDETPVTCEPPTDEDLDVGDGSGKVPVTDGDIVISGYGRTVQGNTG